MEFKSRQEIFDHVVGALRKQNSKSLNNIGSRCVYKNNKGFKCAAGHLIKDDLYKESFEGKSIIYDDVEKNEPTQALLDSGINPEDLILVKDLQNIHDIGRITSWEKDWERLASLYDLIYKAPNE